MFPQLHFFFYLKKWYVFYVIRLFSMISQTTKSGIFKSLGQNIKIYFTAQFTDSHIWKQMTAKDKAFPLMSLR